MKRNVILVMAACGVTLLSANRVNAQNEVVVVQEDVMVADGPACKAHYYAGPRDNWFLQMGAGINSPFVENRMAGGDAHRQITAAYNIGFGKWFSPYLGWRMSTTYASLHWQNWQYSKARSLNANFDLMWDMFNTFGGVNPGRVFSILPFVGIGGNYNWDFRGNRGNVVADGGGVSHHQWTLPVSAGLQMRWRLCPYADFFIEGRAAFHGDNYNNYVYGKPVDVNIAALGGFVINFGGRGFKSFNPCDGSARLAMLNSQVNELREDLADCVAAQAATAAALAECVNQQPTTVAADCPEVAQPSLMPTVRFAINSSRISPEEMVNVYSVAEWMKANPAAKVVINGYADKDTGSSGYNMELSRRRARAVYEALTATYGIAADRLTVDPLGSGSQPYDTNSWNRIVTFSPAK